MILGSYPCCNGSLHLVMPDKTPAWQREECPHCGAPVWHQKSRVECLTWLEADFLELYHVDFEKGIIEPKVGWWHAEHGAPVIDPLRKRPDADSLVPTA